MRVDFLPCSKYNLYVSRKAGKKSERPVISKGGRLLTIRPWTRESERRFASSGENKAQYRIGYIRQIGVVRENVVIRLHK